MGGTSRSNKMATMANNNKKTHNNKVERSIPMADASSLATQTISLVDAFVFAMLCIVGLPVEVQVKDGSVYSGIFHTAHISSGVVLKKAKKITEGKRSTNVPLGSFVDTLVILSEDFVQIVVKDFILTSEALVKSLENSAENIDKAINNNKSSSPVQNGSSKTHKKESKLNASARSFSPKPRLVPPVASSPVLNQLYVPSIKTTGSPPVVPSIGAYSIVPNRPFVTEKPILYNNINNFAPANGVVTTPYPQPILGYENTRVQPIGVVNPYRPVQFAPNYLTPNPPNVMAPRQSLLMCMHPISQAAIRGPTLISNPMLNPYNTTLQKFQGPPPILTAPLVLNQNRPLMIPSPINFAPNFGPMRPIIVPNGPGFFPTSYV